MQCSNTNVTELMAASLIESCSLKYGVTDSLHVWYDGPLLLIRRTNDEMITVGEGVALVTNRGNFLLTDILAHRYPKLMDSSGHRLLQEYLALGDQGHRQLLSEYNVEPDVCMTSLRSYADVNSTEFPLNIGDNLDETTRHQLLLYLANKYMVDFDSTHCTPLPASKLSLPWTLDNS